MGNVWVVPQNGMWAVRIEGNERASRVFRTQKEAEEYGRSVARERHCEFILCGADGKIRVKDSYGNDPYPPRG